MSENLLISDAAKMVQVESHVLRYWEEELKLPIRRNELGHRYYTQEDVDRFKAIKGLKERGLQLKAIKMILKDGKFETLDSTGVTVDSLTKGEEISKETLQEVGESREEKAQKLQWILQQLIKQAVRENNAELVTQIKESVIKELDYQFRMQEDRAEERTENYYQKLDELLRKKNPKRGLQRTEKKKTPKTIGEKVEIEAITSDGQTQKKKRHFIF